MTVHPAFVSFVLCVRDEETPVGPFLEELASFLAGHFDRHEIVVVDDASIDSTAEAVRRAAPGLPGALTLVRLAHAHGRERAMLAGLDRAMGDYVFELETPQIDFALDVLTEMFDKATAGFDIVAACPDPPIRRNRAFYWIVNRFSDLDLDLTTERVRLVSRRALDAMLLMKERVRYRKALYCFGGHPRARVSFVPLPGAAVKERGFDRGTVALAFDIVTSFSDVGLRAAHVLSVVFALFSVSAIGWAVWNYLFNEGLVSGWTTIMITTAVGFTGVFFLLGIIGEYLARILVEVRDRPLYAIQESRTWHLTEADGAAGDKEPGPYLLGQISEAARLVVEESEEGGGSDGRPAGQDGVAPGPIESGEEGRSREQD